MPLPTSPEAMRPFFARALRQPETPRISPASAPALPSGNTRASVASLLHRSPKEIVFTSGGTEKHDNLALWRFYRRFSTSARPAHLITTQIEHHAVLFAAKVISNCRGVEVTYLKPERTGVVNPSDFEAALRPHTKLVSVMLANNETGAIQPVGKIARIANAHGALVHNDAAQAAGSFRWISGEFKNVDLLSVSGHKMSPPARHRRILCWAQGCRTRATASSAAHTSARRRADGDRENVPDIACLAGAPPSSPSPGSKARIISSLHPTPTSPQRRFRAPSPLLNSPLAASTSKNACSP